MAVKVIERYKMMVNDIPVDIKIFSDPQNYIPIYEIIFPGLEPAVMAALDSIRERL